MTDYHTFKINIVNNNKTKTDIKNKIMIFYFDKDNFKK